MSKAMTYRPEVDGLRTIAVMPVILFHAGFTVFQGGFVGVDVFFVISGYLITTILINELDRGDFSILRFYERRARRILPALFAVIVCTIPIAWMVLDPARFTDFSESIIATILFASNFLFWMESGYFDEGTENKPLLHTWSLAVEEQYYIFFPVMLLLLWRYGRRSALGTILVLTVISFGLCLWGARNASSANYYLLPFRMWELFVGSICAFLATSAASQRGSEALAALGLAMVIASVFLISSDMPFPGVVTLGPVLGTALIILFARPGTWTARALSLKGMVWIGLISYSLYLWHQPIFALARLRLNNGRMLDLPEMGVLVVLTFILAALTYWLIEQPFRKRGKRSGKRWFEARPRLFAASGVAMAAFIAFGLFGVVSNGAAMRFPPNYATLIASFDDRSELPCKFEPNNPIPEVHPAEQCLVLAEGGNGETVMILGDSHAWSLSQTLSEALAGIGLNTYVMTYAACPPVPGMYILEADRPEECNRFVTEALDYAKAAGIRQIIVAARFQSHILGSAFDNGEGGVETATGPARAIDATWDGSGTIPDRAARLARIRAALPERLAAMSREFDLIVLEPVPEAGWHVPRRGMEIIERTEVLPHLTTSFDAVRTRIDPVHEMLQEIYAHDHGHVDIVPITDLFCDAETGRCDNIVDGAVLYYDDDHLSNTGTWLVAPRVIEAVQAARARS
ncbi:MAG: acyltransferase family protein [Pseudomonadota bacterium]